MEKKLSEYGFYFLFFIYTLSVPISYNIANAVLLLLLIFFIFHIKTNKKIFKNPLYLPIGLFLLSFFISSITGYDSKIALREITLFKGFLIMIIAMNVFPKNKKFFTICILFFLLATSINVFYSFFERLKHKDIAYRVAALWGHYKFYAKFLIIAIFIELFYLIYTSKKWAKILCFLLIITSIFSLILTASRTEIIFTLVGIIVFLSFYKARLTIAFSIFILTILTISFLKIPVFKNRLKPMFFKDNKFGFYMLDVKQWKERMKTWKMGIEVLKTNYKYFGVGLGNSRKFIIKELKMDMKIKNLHNSFIEVIVSFGIFGFLIFIYFLFTYFFEIYKSISYFKNTDFFYYGLGLFISSFILFIFVGFIDDIFWNKRVMMQLLYLVGILLSFKRNENSISI